MSIKKTQEIFTLENPHWIKRTNMNMGIRHDRQDLGFILKANKTLKIREVDNNNNLVFRLLGNDDYIEKSNKLSSEWISIKADKDLAAFIDTPLVDYSKNYDIKVEWIIENPEDIVELPVYSYNKSEEDFYKLWDDNNAEYALIKDENFQLLVPKHDEEYLKKRKYFNSINELIENYQKIFEIYNGMAGLDNSTPENKKIKNRYFLKADIHGAGGAYYGTYWTANSTKTTDMWLNGGNEWGTLHEIGHGYQTGFDSRGMYTGEVSNNLFAAQFQYTTLGKIADRKGWLLDYGNVKNVDNKLYTELIEKNKSYQSLSDLRLQLVILAMMKQKATNEAFIELYKGYRKDANEPEFNNSNYYLQDLINKYYSEYSKFDFTGILKRLGTIIRDKNQIIYNRSKGYPAVAFLADVVPKDKLKDARDVIDKKYMINTNFQVVDNSEIKELNLKGNLLVHINTKSIDNLINKKILLKDGKKVVQEKIITGENIEFNDVPNGIYSFEFQENILRDYNYSEDIYAYVKESENKCTIDLKKFESTIANQTIKLLGLGDGSFGNVNINLDEKEIAVNITNSTAHNYFPNETYCAITIKDSNNKVKYKNDLKGLKNPVGNFKTPLELDDIIEIYHAETGYKRLDSDDKIIDYTKKTNIFVVTKYGLINQSLLNNPYNDLLVKIENYADKLIKNKELLDIPFNHSFYKKNLYFGINNLKYPENHKYFKKYSTVLEINTKKINSIEKPTWIFNMGKNNPINHDKQDLGFILKENSKLRICQMNSNFKEKIVLKLIGDNTGSEKTIEVGTDLVEVSTNIPTVPFINTPYGKENPEIMYIVENDEIINLPIYSYNDDENKFYRNWNENTVNYALIKNKYFQMLLSKEDKELLKNSEKFSSINKLIEKYEKLFELYNNVIGLDNSEETNRISNVRLFFRNNKGNSSSISFTKDWLISNEGTSKTWLWGQKHEWEVLNILGKIYEGDFNNKSISYENIINNLFGVEYEYNKNGKLADEIGWLFNYGKREIVDDQLYTELVEKNNQYESIKDLRLKLILLTLIKQKAGNEAHSRIYRAYRKDNNLKNATLQDLMNKYYSEYSNFDFMGIFKRLGINITDKKQSIYNKNKGYPAVTFLADIVPKDKLKDARNIIDKKYLINSNFEIVENKEIKELNLKGNLLVHINTENINNLINEKILLKDGDKVIQEKIITGSEIKFNDIPNGIYSFEFIGNKLKYYNCEEDKYVYVKDNENECTINLNKFKLDICDQTINLLGLGDFKFGTLDIKLSEKLIILNIKDSTPHNYYENKTYCEIIIKNSQNKIKYMNSIQGTKVPVGAFKTSLDINDIIEIYHAEASNRINSEDNIIDNTTKTNILVVTEYGLENRSLLNNPYNEFLNKIDKYGNELRENKELQQIPFHNSLHKKTLYFAIDKLKYPEKNEYFKKYSDILEINTKKIFSIEKPTWIFNVSKYNPINHDKQDLGIILNENSKLRICQINSNFKEKLVLKLIGNNTQQEKTIEIGSEWVEVSAPISTVPFINTPYSKETAEIIYMVESSNEAIKLPIYEHNDNENEFYKNWDVNKVNYALIKDKYFQILLSKEDKEIINTSKKFDSINRIIEKYELLFKLYNNSIGLDDSEETNKSSNIRLFFRNNKGNTDNISFTNDWLISNGGTSKTWLWEEKYDWAVLNLIGKIYEGEFSNKSISHEEVINNLFGVEYEYDKHGKFADNLGWLFNYGKKEVVDGQLYSNIIENNATYESIKDLRLKLILLSLIKQKAGNKAHTALYKAYRKNNNMKNDSLQDLMNKYYSEYSKFDFTSVFRRLGINLNNKDQIKYNQSMKYRPVAYLVDIVPKNKLEKAREAVDPIYLINSNFMVVQNKDITSLNLKGDLSININSNNISGLKELTLQLKDGSKVVQEKTIEENKVLFTNVPNGIYTINIVGNAENNYTVSDENYVYVKEEKNEFNIVINQK